MVISYLPGASAVISSTTRPAAIPVPITSNLSCPLRIVAFLQSRRLITSIDNDEASCRGALHDFKRNPDAIMLVTQPNSREFGGAAVTGGVNTIAWIASCDSIIARAFVNRQIATAACS
jgi:hypothetical protein